MYIQYLYCVFIRYSRGVNWCYDAAILKWPGMLRYRKNLVAGRPSPHSGLSRNWARLTGTGQWSRLTNGSSGMWEHSAMYQRRKGRTVSFSCSIQTDDYSHGLPFTCQWFRWNKDLPRSAANQPVRSDLFHAGIEFIFQGRDNLGGATCCGCVAFSLWWFAADMCKRYRTHLQPHLINLENGSAARRWWWLQFLTRNIWSYHVHH